LKTSLFDFHLPESRIATRPVSPRDSARMLAVAGEEMIDGKITDLPSFLGIGDVMVFNDSRVIPARLRGKRGSAKIEILLHKNIGGSLWECFAKPARKLRTNDVVTFADDFTAVVRYKTPEGQVALDFNVGNVLLSHLLEQHGQMPLPPYIEKRRAADESDKTDYQTVYAAYEGSVAAPTAGLHFTPKLLQTIDKMFVKCVQVTLHVGAGTFLPVKARHTEDHVMHPEWATLSKETAAAINAAKQKGGRVIAVGTTALRTLETAADEQGVVQPFEGKTDIFITPGYRFKCVDVLLTNFHLPRSTLFMLVCAFAGTERMKAAYKHAIKNKYRFYSYGDACLLFKE